MTTTTRRDFLKTIGLATVCACTGMAAMNGCSMIKGVSATETIPDYAWKLNDDAIIIDLAKSECIALPGSAGKLLVDTSEEKPLKLIIVHHDKGQFKVFSDCCTHSGRELNYLHEEGKLQCSSFGHSEFSMKGQAIKGTAEGPLAVYPVEKLNHNALIINIV